MKILIIEPYLTDSHQQWIDGFKAREDWEVKVLALPARHWKWRMHAASITMAQAFSQAQERPNLILVSEMMDVPLFKALITQQGAGDIPILLYFHENQLTYPFSSSDRDAAKSYDNHYAFQNYASALVADQVIFNSTFHRSDFLDAIPPFLKQYPKPNTLEISRLIKAKSQVIYPGIDLRKMDAHRISHETKGPPVILWNHRWEYDKNPDLFFKSLFELQAKEVKFQLVVLGKSHRQAPSIFKEARKKLQPYILHWGYADNPAEYIHWLWRSDIMVSTSMQDFFGISVVEAIYCGCWPLVPSRLALPEHIPKSLTKQCVYAHDKDLLHMIMERLSQWPFHPREMDQLREHQRRYDLAGINCSYHDLFEGAIR